MKHANLHPVALTSFAFGAIAALAGTQAFAQIAVRNQGYIPFSDAPINYRSEDLKDPVAKLQERLAQSKAKLDYEPQHGYLTSVLKLLDVPVESQTLVFSKTSFQYPKISPEHPRALYFNDDVYVGSVHDGKAIEIVSFDARQGAIFYLLDEQKAEKPAFQRAELDCTQCHIAAGTRGVPGVLLRSVRPTATGMLVPGSPTLITDQDSPVKDRWGGWYVTGSLAASSLANSADGELPAYDASTYLTPTSDQVALLVLAHQTQMHNLVTLTNYKTRIALYSAQQDPASGNNTSGAGDAAPSGALSEATRRQFERPAEQLLRYMLFTTEAPIPGAEGHDLVHESAFARSFAARGPRDSHGRSLRDFDLQTRVFRYPCSYLIYSDDFDALPEPAKGYVYHRLLEILSSQDNSADFARLTPADREAVLEILLETKTGLPAEWIDYAHTKHLRTGAKRAGI